MRKGMWKILKHQSDYDLKPKQPNNGVNPFTKKENL